MPIDGLDFRSPGRLLIAAAGYAENTAMGYLPRAMAPGASRSRLSTSACFSVGAEIVLPAPAALVWAWSLDERGQRKAAVEVKPVGSRAKLVVDPGLRDTLV